MTELYEGRKPDRNVAAPRGATAWVAAAMVGVFAGIGVATIGSDVRDQNPATTAVQRGVIRGISSRIVELTFNPRSVRGLKVAKVAFRFTYEHSAADRERVRQRVEEAWNPSVSRALRALMRHSPDELKSDDGMEVVERDLRAVLDESFFADGLAHVQEILWEQVLVQ